MCAGACGGRVKNTIRYAGSGIVASGRQPTCQRNRGPFSTYGRQVRTTYLWQWYHFYSEGTYRTAHIAIEELVCDNMNPYPPKLRVKKSVLHSCPAVHAAFGCCAFKRKSGSIDTDSRRIRTGHFGDSVDRHFETATALAAQGISVSVSDRVQTRSGYIRVKSIGHNAGAFKCPS